MTNRLLSPNERMTDAFDRASTLNFTTVARVRGSTSEAELRAALGSLEQRHPLLRAGIERKGKQTRFIADGGAPIPLFVRDGARDEVLAIATQTLAHRTWSDEGPRAELTYVRHGVQDFSLVLLLHHVVSDGSSGIFAMRDLLSFLGGEPLSSAPVASPGSLAILPKRHAGLWSYLRTLRLIVASSRGEKPRRLHAPEKAPVEQRVPVCVRIELDDLDTQHVAQRARRVGATVHGLLCAAMALSVQRQLAAPWAMQRVLSPVCLRRYLRARGAARADVADAVGCYVSSIETDHRVVNGGDLSLLAREVTTQLQRKKADGVPLLTAPVAGPLLTDRFERAPPGKLQKLAEEKLMLSTFSITNLGNLESQLDLHTQYGALTLDDIYFVAAGSVLGALGASVTTYRGRLTMAICGVEPLITRAQLNAMRTQVEALLHEFARGAEQAAE